MNIADKRFILTAIALSLFLLPEPLLGSYTLVLKNGRRITVQSYREEGGVIKIFGLGGEIGISKDQIQAILEEGGEPVRGSLFIPPKGEAPAPAPSVGEKGEAEEAKAREGKTETAPPGEGQAPGEPLPLTPEEQKAKLEKEYQEKVKKITDELKAARERYAFATKGSASQDPSLLTTEEAIQARTDDLISRLRNSQHSPTGAASDVPVQLTTPSQFAGQPPTTTELKSGGVIPSVNPPPPGYTTKQQELSQLRKKITELETQRDKLIHEMRQKNLDTGSLFLE